MLTFTENLDRIDGITKQIRHYIEEKNYRGAKEHFDMLHVYAIAAQILLDEFRAAEKRSYPIDEVFGL